MIFYICLQNVDGNFHRQFLPIEDIGNVVLLLAKRRCKTSVQNVDENFHRHFASVSESH